MKNILIYLLVFVLISVIKSESQDKINSTIYSLIHNGNYTELDLYLSKLHVEKQNFDKILSKNVDYKIKELSNIVNNLLKKNTKNYKIYSPAFYWSETEWEVTLEIYYSELKGRLSCGDLEEHNETLINNNETFIFSVKCSYGDEDKEYFLKLNLFAKISEIKRVTLSRKQAFIVLGKEKTQHWFQLLKDGEEVPKNMYYK